MTRKDLSPTMQKAYDALSPQYQEAFLSEQSALQEGLIRGSIVRAMMRAQSHNLGTNANAILQANLI